MAHSLDSDPPAPHYEIWGGFCATAEVGPEFLETALSLGEARTVCEAFRREPDRYAYVRDMNNNGETVQ